MRARFCLVVCVRVLLCLLIFLAEIFRVWQKKNNDWTYFLFFLFCFFSVFFLLRSLHCIFRYYFGLKEFSLLIDALTSSLLRWSTDVSFAVFVDKQFLLFAFLRLFFRYQFVVHIQTHILFLFSLRFCLTCFLFFFLTRRDGLPLNVSRLSLAHARNVRL